MTSATRKDPNTPAPTGISRLAKESVGGQTVLSRSSGDARPSPVAQVHCKPKYRVPAGVEAFSREGAPIGTSHPRVDAAMHKLGNCRALRLPLGASSAGASGLAGRCGAFRHGRRGAAGGRPRAPKRRRAGHLFAASCCVFSASPHGHTSPPPSSSTLGPQRAGLSPMAAFTIARMPALIGGDSSGQTSTSRASSGSAGELAGAATAGVVPSSFEAIRALGAPDSAPRSCETC